MININKIIVFIIIASLLLLTSCAEVIPVEDCVDQEEIFGFWMGLLHGIIAPFTFIVSLFDDEVAIYAINNNGGWYNFGFLLGAGVFLGGSGSKAKKR